jgi:hypothetical protein
MVAVHMYAQPAVNEDILVHNSTDLKNKCIFPT